MSRAVGVLALGFLLPMSMGCATFAAGRLEPVRRWPPGPVTGSPAIRVGVRAERVVNGRAKALSEDALDVWSRQVVGAYLDSGLFSTVDLGEAHGGGVDRVADVAIFDRNEINPVLQSLSLLTLGLVPVRMHSEFVVSTTIRDELGRALYSVRKEETLDTWMHLSMVFFLASNAPGKVELGTLYDINRATLVDANAARAFFVRPATR